MRAAGSYRVTSIIVLAGAFGTIGGHVSSVMGETENGKRLTSSHTPPKADLSADAAPQAAVRSEESAALTRKDVEFERVRAVARASGSVRVIVQLDVPNLNALAAGSHSAKGHGPIAVADGQLSTAIAGVRQAELGKLVGVPYTVNRTYASLPFIALTVSEQALNVLRASPNVLGINEDHLAAPTLDNTVNITGASAAWAQGFDGSGWYVAILDTGIRASHNFFAGKNIIQACFSSGEDGAPGVGDCPNGLSTDTTSANAARHFPTSPSSDHGTHVSGIATGNDPTRVPPLYGIARGADIIAIQVFSQFFGLGDVRSYDSDQIAGLQHVYSLRSTYNIASVNMSLGGGQYSDEASCDSANAGVKAAIDNLRGAGIATVIASGNNGYCGFLSGPGCISTAVAVGNTFDSDVESSGSNYHATLLDLFAPGSSILSSVGNSNSSYSSYSGTSMAAPHVAGAWAVLKQLAPAADVSAILNALQSTGNPVTGHCPGTPTQRRIQIDLALGQFGIKFHQPPDSTGEDVASNIDTDMAPNIVVADDFVSDGRPIHSVRWWGSNLLPTPPIDGWLISFHEPLLTGGAAAPPLGLYFCDISVVNGTSTPLTACDAHAVIQYTVDLVDCCLIHANPDSRPPALVPAQTDGFHEQECFAYDIDIQAVVGRKYVDSGGTCVEVLTGNSATDNVWGWHTTSIEHGLRAALQSTVTMAGSNWLYGPWVPVAPSCSAPNMAFQLSTNTVGSTSDCNDNGIPDQCETGPDCQPNGRLDECDIASGFVADCNGNSVPDECDLPTDPDCNNNNVLDECDTDCNNSGIPDECEIASDPDCNGNGVLDVCDNKSVGSLTGAIAAVLGFVDISATGTPLNLGDDASTNVTMPFTTAAFGGPTVSVANNGGVGLVPSTGLGAVDNWPIPHVNAFGGNAGMLAYWDDLDSTTGNVYYQTVGVTPSQTFIVQWHNRPHFAGDLVLDGDEVTFEVQIFESPVGGVLAQYLYADTNFLNAAFNNGASATVGYQRSATSAIQWSLDTAGAVTSGMVLSLLAGDLNDNGRPDYCDIRDCPPNDLACRDCQPDGIPDSCQLAGNDANGNGVPDECDPPGEIVWDSEPLSPDRTTRSLRFKVTSATTGTPLQDAIEVTMVDLQHPIPANLAAQAPPNFTTYDTRLNGVCNGGTLVGHHCDTNADCPSSTCGSLAACTAVGEANSCARWVGKPGTFLENQDVPTGASYRAARLQCTPYYHDWVTETASGPITVVGAEIAPSSEYSVQTYGVSCMGAESTCAAVSPAVTMYTRRSGDAAPNFNPPSTTGQPDALDVAAVVNKLKNLPGALVKAIVQLQPNLPELNANVNALDIVAVVDAVRQIKYGFSGPCTCPSAVTCGGACGTGCPAPNMCVKTCTGGTNDGQPCIDSTRHCPGGTCGTPLCRDRCGRCKP